MEIQRRTFGLRKELVSVLDIVHEVKKLFNYAYGQEKHLEVRSEGFGEGTRILLDKQRIKQVLANLVSNAIK